MELDQSIPRSPFSITCQFPIIFSFFSVSHSTLPFFNSLFSVHFFRDTLPILCAYLEKELKGLEKMPLSYRKNDNILWPW